MHVLLLAILCLFGLQDGQPPEDPSCRTCSGKGIASLQCDLCKGDGKGACIECVPGAGFSYAATKDKIKNAGRRKITIAVVPLPGLGSIGGEFSSRAGHLRCPSNCRKGKAFLVGGDCQPCGTAGWFDCKGCRKKGTGPCRECGGRRKHVSPCPECLGEGTSPDPLLCTIEQADACPWCKNARTLACHGCDGDKKREIPCPNCFGTRKRVCTTCKGGERRPCNPCSGTGEVPARLLDPAQPCSRCKAKGFRPCLECKRGTVECGECDKKGRVIAICQICCGEGKGLCRGCYGGTGRSWTATGTRLMKAGHSDRAAAYFKVALQHEETRVAKTVARFRGTDKERDSYRRELEQGLRPLRLKLKDAEKGEK